MTKFAIVDIETTGGHYRYSKITEIAIIVIENGKEIKKFESLINPECIVPTEITRITGINNQMLENAPKFYEIAKDILEITQDCIFVAHNVSFDYGFIKEEFKNLGYTFQRKKLCTVTLSRKYFPGLKSYSLGNLIKNFEINVLNRHRAYDDAWATVQIFKKMLDLQESEDLDFKKYVKGALKESRMPPGLPDHIIEELPEECGVYYMADQDGEYVYIGKSKHIKERIIQHFSDINFKSSKMIRAVTAIHYHLTGSELMASLIESRDIKIFKPEINRAQRQKSEAYAIIRTLNSEKFPILQVKHKDQLIGTENAIQLFSNSKKANSYLDYLISQYDLCLNIQENKSNKLQACQRKQIGLCRGACVGDESFEDYEERFDSMFHKVNRFFKEDLIIEDIGRNQLEKSIIIIEKGFCSYIGYIQGDSEIVDLDDLKSQLESYKGNIESNGIIFNFLHKNPKTRKHKIIYSESGQYFDKVF
ncbi:MAG: GIY-YIG nuclease family protein [Saprospiraceae bacterium]|nr:GIY-YIG nuclease family protein [Saprospiraceae bacterium]MBK9632667.1 GIY-YIG nuclease family protein [Saprospiraceae bacterium]